MTVDAYGAALVSGVAHGCSSFSCPFEPRMIRGEVAGLGFSMRRVRVGVEVHTGAQMNATQQLSNQIYQYGRRDTTTSVLGGWRLGGSSATDISLLAGAAMMHTNMVDVVLRASPILPAGTFFRSRSKWGVTFGANVAAPLGARVGVVMPVRVMLLRKDRLDPFGTTRDLRIGAGLTVRFFRRVG